MKTTNFGKMSELVSGKYLSFLVLFFLLQYCASAIELGPRKVKKKSGKTRHYYMAYQVTCDQDSNDSCYSKAAEICPGGFDIIKEYTTSTQVPMSTYQGQAGNVPIFAYGTSTVINQNIDVGCK